MMSGILFSVSTVRTDAPVPSLPQTNLTTMSGEKILALTPELFQAQVTAIYTTDKDRFNVLLATYKIIHSHSEKYPAYLIHTLLKMLDVSGKMDIFEAPVAAQQDLLFTLPDDVLKSHLLPYLKMNDIDHLRRACKRGRAVTAHLLVEKNIPGKLMSLYELLKSQDKTHHLRRISCQQALILYRKTADRKDIHALFLPYPRNRTELIHRVETALSVDNKMENYSHYQSIQPILGYYRVTKGLANAHSDEAKLAELDKEWGAPRWKGCIYSLIENFHCYIDSSEIPIFIKYWFTRRKIDRASTFIFVFLDQILKKRALPTQLIVFHTIADLYLNEPDPLKTWTTQCLQSIKHTHDDFLPSIKTVEETMPMQLEDHKKIAVQEFLQPFIERQSTE